MIGRPELADDPGYATTAARIARREQVDGLVAAWVAQRTVAEAEAALLAEGLPIVPVRVRSGSPALGANNDEILAELAIDAAEREELAGAGVI